MPTLDATPLIPWVGWGATILIAIGLVYRKVKAPDFDALEAEEVFTEYVKSKGYKTKGEVESEEEEVVGTKQFVVAQPIEKGNHIEILIMSIDSHHKHHNKRWDRTGEVYREKLGRDAIIFNREMRKDSAKYTPEEVYDLASQRMEEYFNERKNPRKEEKENRTRELLSRDQSQKRYSVEGGEEDEQ
jgi:hypothetical protein